MTDNTKEEQINEEDSTFVRTIEIELEDGTIEECEVLEPMMEIDGKKYVALLPLDDNEFHVFECISMDDESIEISSIEDEDVEEKVIVAFEEYFGAEEEEE